MADAAFSRENIPKILNRRLLKDTEARKFHPHCNSSISLLHLIEAQWRKAGSVVRTGSLSEAKQWAAAFQPTPLEICAETLQRILGSHDRPIIKAAARAKLERVLRYYDEGHVNLLIVTIIESADNEDALIAPVIEAVHSVMTRHREWTEKGSEWLEAFDHLPPLMTILEVMRELGLFLETSLGKYLGMILENKLRKHFEPELIEEPRVERKSKAERVIEEGLFLLQHKGPHATSRITKLAFDKFGLIPPIAQR
jgi:hypothetical protein